MPVRPNAYDPTRHKYCVAIEGPCCAGKTTLSRGLFTTLDAITICNARDYSDHVGGGRFLPRPIPQSIPEDQLALQRLVEIEAERLACPHDQPHDLMLLDRSVYTLLAHRHAIYQVTGLDCLTPAQRTLIGCDAIAWPDLVFYLDVTDQVIRERNQGKFPPGNIFIDSGFNAAIRDFYDRTADSNRTSIVWLDATLDILTLLKTAEARLDHLFRSPS